MKSHVLAIALGAMTLLGCEEPNVPLLESHVMWTRHESGKAQSQSVELTASGDVDVGDPAVHCIWTFPHNDLSTGDLRCDNGDTSFGAGASCPPYGKIPVSGGHINVGNTKAHFTYALDMRCIYRASDLRFARDVPVY